MQPFRDDPFLERLLGYFSRQSSQSCAPITHLDASINELIDSSDAAQSRYRQAAVLIPVMRATSTQDSHIVFTLRAETLSSHAGQVSFPGGSVDPGDRDAVHTALRESHEEIGLEPGSVQILGQLGKLILPSGFCVTPVVGLIEPDVLFTPSPHEVAGIFQVPSSLVLNPGNFGSKLETWRDIQRQVLELHFEQYRIWGATATILHHLGSQIQQNSSAR